MVFENELDLRAHELSVHGGTSTGSTKINLEFRTRRVGYDGSGLEEQQTAPSESDFNYTLDGQAFVPEALPTSNQNSNTTTTKNLANRNNSVQLHPLHMQRTEEFRVQAAVMREQQASQSHEESFPSLQSASGSLSAPLVGWASGTTTQRVNVRKKDAGKVTTEDFPSLPTAPSAKANAKKKAITGNLGGTTRQFGAMTTAASQPHASWGGAVGSAPAVARGPSNNFLTPPAPVASVNRQTNLTADNFPSLGPSANTRQNYASANAFAKKNLQHQNNAYARAPSLNSTTDFPSIGSNSSLATKRTHQPAAAPPPSMSNVEDFPAPPSASNRNQNSVRSHMLGDSSKRQPTQQAVSNVLKANVSSAVATATVEEMKASLGPNKFKQLKRLTKSFAEDQLSPEGYVDQSAALFDRGYGDSDFWSFLPSLLESCPNQGGAERAQIYMASLSHQQFARNMSSSTPAPAPSGWGGARNNNIMKGPPTAARPLTQAVSGRPNVVFPSKKKNTWGATGAATVVRAKAPPGSVAAAAAAQGPQGGTATKFMAKQEKEKKKKQNQANQPKANGKKKGSTKNELRALAFGK